MISQIGQSFENRFIYRVLIGEDHLPKISIDCGIHAREWASPGKSKAIDVTDF